ncbi:MAG: Gfo/Idh/MocA family oxidoreductase [Planctomycetaceae bacterium]
MSESKQFNVAMIGLGFGAEFLPIYQAHPLANIAAICRRDQAEMNKIGDKLGIEKRYTSYEDVLADPSIDFVHINSPIPDHAWMSKQALKAGKHVMCTVPMATTIEECDEICQLVDETGLKYMMAETVVYSREFLFIKSLYESGELGKIQFMKASHPQDMDGWPDYWKDMIPMHYATHVVSPVLGLVDGCAEYVSCFGSGSVRDEIKQRSGNPFAVEKVVTSKLPTAMSPLRSGVSCMTPPDNTGRALMSTVRRNPFEWTLIEGDPHVLHTAKKPEHEIPERIEVPDFAHLLPPEIQKFTQSIEDADHLSFVQGGGHGGSHPHLVNEFLSALAEDRDPWPNAVQSANWTCVGICAHQSTMKGGEIVKLPGFTIK